MSGICAFCAILRFSAAVFAASWRAGLSCSSGTSAGGLVLPIFIVRRMGEISGKGAAEVSCWRQGRCGGDKLGGS